MYQRRLYKMVLGKLQSALLIKRRCAESTNFEVFGFWLIVRYATNLELWALREIVLSSPQYFAESRQWVLREIRYWSCRLARQCLWTHIILHIDIPNFIAELIAEGCPGLASQMYLASSLSRNPTCQ